MSNWISQVRLNNEGIDIDIRGDGSWECIAAPPGKIPAWLGHWEREEGSIVLSFESGISGQRWLKFLTFEPSSALAGTDMPFYVIYQMAQGLKDQGHPLWAHVVHLTWSAGSAHWYILNHVQENIRLQKYGKPGR